MRGRSARRAAAGTLVALCLAALAACAGRGAARELPRGTALWTSAAEAAALDTARVEGLRAAGFGELFVEAAEIGWVGSTPRLTQAALRPAGAAAAPAAARLPLVLTVTGEWPAAADAGTAGAALATALDGLRRSAEAAGWTSLGFLLDLRVDAGGAALGAYADGVEATAAALGDDALLLVSVDPAWLGDPAAESLAAAADGLVAVLYGARPGVGSASGSASGWEGESGSGPGSGSGSGPGGRPTSDANDGSGGTALAAADASWSLDAVEAGVRRLEALGAPYLVGAGTLGELVVPGTGGAPPVATSRADLDRLLADPALDRPRTAVLEGLDRQTYSFPVVRPLTVGDRRLRRGDELVVHRLAGHHLAMLRDRLAAMRPGGFRGLLLVRPPREGEGLAVPWEGLLAVAAGRTPRPDVELTVDERPGRRGRRLLRVTAVNRGDEATGLATLDANAVRVRAAGGGFGRIDPGGFRRYQLGHGGHRAADTRAMAGADTLELFVPRLAVGGRVESGDLEVRPAAGAPVEVTGSFLGSEGETLTVEARPGSGGEKRPRGEGTPRGG